MGQIRVNGTLTRNARRSVEASGAVAWLHLTMTLDDAPADKTPGDIEADWRYGAGEFAVNQGSVRAARRLKKGARVTVIAKDFRVDRDSGRLKLARVTDVTQADIPAPMCEPQEKEHA
jgi:hypothetical protein